MEWLRKLAEETRKKPRDVMEDTEIQNNELKQQKELNKRVISCHIPLPCSWLAGRRGELPVFTVTVTTALLLLLPFILMLR